MATASSSTRRVTVVFGSDTDSAEQGFRRVRDEADQTRTTTSKLSGMFEKLGPGIVASLGVASVGAAFKTVIGGAIDLNETISKTEQVFKNSGKAVENWSSNSASSMGISKKAALDSASAFGNMYQQIGITETNARKMSTSMVRLASDFASFHNAEPAEVMDALQAATRGEYDALQRYVPTVNAAKVEQAALNETHKKAASALTDAEKATALYNIVVKDAGAATGDFARTADSAANQQRILKARLEDAAASLGQAVLPIFKTFLGLVNDIGPLQTALLGLAVVFGRRITSAVVAARTSVLTWATGVGAAGASAVVASGATTKFGQAIAFAGGAARTATASFRGAAGGMSSVSKAGVALLAIQAATAGFKSNVAPNVEALTVRLKEFGTTGKASGEASKILGDNMRLLTEDVATLDDSFGYNLTEGPANFIESMTGMDDVLEDSLKHSKERLQALDNALAQLVQNGNQEEAAKAFERISKVAREQGRTLDEVKKGFPGYAGALDLIKSSQEEAAKAGDKFSKELDTLRPVMKGASSTAADYDKAIAAIGSSGVDASTQLKEFTVISNGVASSTLNAADKGKAFKTALDGVESSAAPLAERGTALAGVFNNIANAQLNAQTKGDLLKQTLDGIYGAMISQNEAAENVTSTQVLLSDALSKNGQQFDLNTAKTGAHRTATLANRDALEAALVATRDKYVADITAGVNADQARAEYEKATTAVLNQIDPTKRNTTAVKDLVKKYGEIPPAKTTDIKVTGGSEALTTLLKGFALQKGLASNWDAKQTDAYYTQIYRTYVVGGSFIGPVPTQHVNKADGGKVPGSSPHNRADNIPAMLTAREWVHPVNAVDYYGEDVMARIQKRQIPRELLTGYADGGQISGGNTWPYKIPMNPKMPVDVAALQKQYAAMLAGGIGGPIGDVGVIPAWVTKARDTSSFGRDSGVGKWIFEVVKAAGLANSNQGIFEVRNTATGNKSMHGYGRAVDLPASMEIFNFLRSNYGGRLKELIYSPAGGSQIYNGANHYYTGVTRAMHFNHVHASYDKGGVLPPGHTSAVNNTGRDEYVLTPQQLGNVAGSGVTVNVTVQGSVTTEKDLAASIATSVRDELIRHAKRNGGRTGL